MNISLRISPLSPFVRGRKSSFSYDSHFTLSKVAKRFFFLPIDCSQSPIPPESRRDEALCVTDGHLDFKCTERTRVGGL